MVLPMGWVDSPKFLCTFLETLTDVANIIIIALLLVPSYNGIAKIPKTGPGLPHTMDIHAHID